jgi:acyl-coenzyme A thioesterase PaaI-like protein
MKTNLKQIQQQEHLHCLLCGQNNRRGLKLDFQPTADGGVETSLECSKTLQGYKDIIHGGVISALLDSVMTNCLFAHGIKALTAELKIRFSSPVKAKGTIRLKALIEKSFAHFYMLKAELCQGGCIKAKATGKFIAHPQARSADKETALKKMGCIKKTTENAR